MPTLRSIQTLPLLLILTSAHALAQEAKPAEAPAAVAPAAPDASAKQEAARRFEHAIKLYEDADYTLALAEFERVYELVPDYRVLYNIGQVSIQLGRYARALRTLQEYRKRGGAELPSDRAAAVQADLDLLAGRTASLALDVEPAGAEVSIDGVLVGTAPLVEPLIVDVGERRIQVKLGGYVSQSRSFTLAGGDRRESSFALQLEQVRPTQPGPPLVTPLAIPAVTPDATQKPRSSWIWVGWSSAGALAAGALVAGGLGAASASDLKELRETSGPTRTQLDQAQSRAQTRLLIADVLGAAAIATGAVTLYLHLTHSPQKERSPRGTAFRLGFKPNHVSLTLAH